MADGTAPTSTPAAPPQDGGPQVPPNPVQPGSGLPTNDPATNPSAPVNAPNPEGDSQSGTEDFFAGAREAMEDGSPSSFLANLFEDLDLDPPAPAPAPAASATPVQSPAANGGPPPANAPAEPVAVPPGQVDPALLSRVLNPPPQPPQPTGLQPPAAPQPAPAPTAQPGQPGQPPAPPEFVPFDQAVSLPPEVLAAVDHTDPNVRNQALGTIVAATGNETSKRLLGHLQQQVFPRMMEAIVAAVAQAQHRARVMEDVFDGAPQLRFAAPQLIEQCVNAVREKALAGNPHAVWTRQMGKDAQALALAAISSMAGGQMPNFNAPPAQPALPPPPPNPAQPQPAAPHFITQPQMMGDGRWYAQLSNSQWVQVQPPQPAAPAAPAASAPWMTGTPAGGFGPPGVPMPTPASELAAFHEGAGGW